MRIPNPRTTANYTRAARETDLRRSGQVVTTPDPFHWPTALHKTFGPEWITLTPADRALIVRDCTEEGGVSDLADYRRNIGSGNLASYARVMRVRFS